MRWLIGVIGAVFLGRIAGWQGALVGFAVGFVIGVWIEGKARKLRKKGPPPLPKRGIGQTAPQSAAKPPPVLRSSAYRLGASIRVSIGGDSPAPAERRASRGDTKLTWYPAGQPVSYSGLRIGTGMIYSAEKTLGWPGEPSAIITSVSVARMAAHPLQDFGYYPSYENLSAEQRRCYLEWLAAGREDVDPSQRSLGYVFMFFYGLERRILVEGDRDPGS